MPWLLAAPQADVKPVAPIQAQDQGVVSRVEKQPSGPAAEQITAQVTRVAPDPGGTASHGRLGPKYPAMSISSSVLLCYGAIPELDEASIGGNVGRSRLGQDAGQAGREAGHG